jgi:hypothetical protein
VNPSGDAAKLAEKPLSQLVDAQRQPIRITKHRQLVMQRQRDTKKAKPKEINR